MLHMYNMPFSKFLQGTKSYTIQIFRYTGIQFRHIFLLKHIYFQKEITSALLLKEIYRENYSGKYVICRPLVKIT
jgi:hypothetical protein